MCLKSGTVKVVEKTGWKMVCSKMVNGQIDNFIYGFYTPDVWYTAECMVDHYYDYPLGFHLFETKAKATQFMQNWGSVCHKVVKVKYRGLLARGEQNGVPSIVAAQIKFV